MHEINAIVETPEDIPDNVAHFFPALVALSLSPGNTVISTAAKLQDPSRRYFLVHDGRDNSAPNIPSLSRIGVVDRVRYTTFDHYMPCTMHLASVVRGNKMEWFWSMFYEEDKATLEPHGTAVVSLSEALPPASQPLIVRAYDLKRQQFSMSSCTPAAGLEMLVHNAAQDSNTPVAIQVTIKKPDNWLSYAGVANI